MVVKFKKSVLCCFISFIATKSIATCIVIMQQKHSIVVAADSRRMYYNTLSPNSKKIAQSICKIHQRGSIYFAVAGHDDSTLTSLAMSSLVNYGNLGEAMDHFGKNMCRKYLPQMEHEKRFNKESYTYYLTSALAGVAFFGFDKGNPYTYTVYFYMNDKLGSNNSIQTNISYKIMSTPFAVLGFSDHIEKMSVDAIDQLLKTKSSISVVESLVQLEVSKHPDDIAAPIDLLVLNNGIPNWIRRKKDCK